MNSVLDHQYHFGKDRLDIQNFVKNKERNKVSYNVLISKIMGKGIFFGTCKPK